MSDRRLIGLLVILGSSVLLSVAGGGVAGLETPYAEQPEQTVETLQHDESLTTLQQDEGTNALEEDQSPADFEQVENEIDADTVTLAATIDTDGDAAWEIRYRLRLEDDTDEAAFEDLAADIEANRSAYLDPFEERLLATAESAATATGREMTVEDFDIGTDRQEQPQATFGVVTYSFEWQEFAAVDEAEIRAGDALDQLYLDENERLQFGWPESHRLESSDPEPETVEDQRVVWRGSIDFDAGQPRIVLTPADDRAGGVRWFVAGAGLLAVAVLGFGAYWRYRTVSDREPSAEHPKPAGEVDETPSDTPTGMADSDTATDEQEPPMELLSNEEQLLRLLDENGGRMKQKEAADELGWSAAKTSQVVGDLRDESELESFRLGRENVLTHPDVDLQASGDQTDGEQSGDEPTDR